MHLRLFVLQSGMSPIFYIARSLYNTYTYALIYYT